MSLPDVNKQLTAVGVYLNTHTHFITLIHNHTSPLKPKSSALTQTPECSVYHLHKFGDFCDICIIICNIMYF